MSWLNQSARIGVWAQWRPNLPHKNIEELA